MNNEARKKAKPIIVTIENKSEEAKPCTLFKVMAETEFLFSSFGMMDTSIRDGVNGFLQKNYSAFCERVKDEEFKIFMTYLNTLGMPLRETQPLYSLYRGNEKQAPFYEHLIDFHIDPYQINQDISVDDTEIKMNKGDTLHFIMPPKTKTEFRFYVESDFFDKLFKSNF